MCARRKNAITEWYKPRPVPRPDFGAGRENRGVLMMKKLYYAAVAAAMVAVMLLAPGCMMTEIVTSMQAEGDATFMFSDSGTLYRWGDGSTFGGEDTYAALPFTDVPGAIDFAFGDGFAVWLTSDGVAVSGAADMLPVDTTDTTGTTGTTDTGTVPPTLLCTLNSTGLESSFEHYSLVDADLSTARQVAAGDDFALVLLQDGSVYGFGANAGALLTDGAADGVVALGALSDACAQNGEETVAQITARGGLCAAVTSEGRLLYWGENLPLASAAPAVLVQAESTGEFIVALDAEGSVWQFDIVKGEATKLSSPANVISLSAGDGFAVAVDKDGQVWSWGVNDSMQLGRETGEADAVPAMVEGVDGAIAVSCGRAHSVVLRKDGTLWVWGAGESGQLASVVDASAEPIKLPEISTRVDVR